MKPQPDLAGIRRRILAKDPFLWKKDPSRHKELADRLGWLESPDWALDNSVELRGFAEEVRRDGISEVLLLGMGGSSLAPEVFSRILGPAPGCPRLAVLDTVDPASVLATWRRLDPGRTLVLVSSKSGSTIETSTLYEYFRARMDEALGREAGRHFAAITDPGTPLEALARRSGFRRVLPGLPEVGGRFSALTAFGMAPAALLGADIERIARAAKAGLKGDGAQELGLLLASGPADQAPLKLTLHLPPALLPLGDWIEQLVAESTGKEGRGVLPVVESGPEPGSQAEDRRHLTLQVEGAHGVGGEMARWMLATAVAGALMGINPFDQPDVQSAKDITQALLRESEAGRPVPDPEGVPSVAAADAARAVRSLLRGIAPPQYAAILAFVPSDDAVRRALGLLREAAQALARPAAVTAGIGPRYLHSTGQLHKGGPPNGVFLQLVSDDPEDAAIPGRPYTFGVLKRAQAAGDLGALARRGRPALRVRLGTDAARDLTELSQSLSL